MEEKKTKKRILRKIVTVFIVVALVITALSFLSYLYFQSKKPVISSLDPSIGRAGDVLIIQGENFGSEQLSSFVVIAGFRPTISSYISWSDTEIRLRLSDMMEGGLVHVETPRGNSNSLLFTEKDSIPVLFVDTMSTTKPFIKALSPEKASVGDEIVIQGLNFGANKDTSTVQFSWVSQEEGVAVKADEFQNWIDVNSSIGSYSLWTDTEIRVSVPDGAVSGAVRVKTSRGVSAQSPFEVTEVLGKRIIGQKKTYVFSLALDISNVNARLPNEFYFWLQRPLDNVNQRGIQSLMRTENPLVEDYLGSDMYHFKDLAASSILALHQTWLCHVFDYSCEVNPDLMPLPISYPAYTKAYLSASPLINPLHSDIKAFAQSAIGTEKNPYKIARKIYNTLLDTVQVTSAKDLASNPVSLKNKRADSYTISLLYCALLRASGIPSVPVSGFLVYPDLKTTQHWWVEWYLPGFGWVPVDPALGSGFAPLGYPTVLDSRNEYFAKIDARHLAFSRGYTVLKPMTSDGRRINRERHYALTNLQEETSLSVTSYTSFWSGITVTGVY